MNDSRRPKQKGEHSIKIENQNMSNVQIHGTHVSIRQISTDYQVNILTEAGLPSTVEICHHNQILTANKP